MTDRPYSVIRKEFDDVCTELARLDKLKTHLRLELEETKEYQEECRVWERKVSEQRIKRIEEHMLAHPEDYDENGDLKDIDFHND